METYLPNHKHPICISIHGVNIKIILWSHPSKYKRCERDHHFVQSEYT